MSIEKARKLLKEALEIVPSEPNLCRDCKYKDILIIKASLEMAQLPACTKFTGTMYNNLLEIIDTQAEEIKNLREENQHLQVKEAEQTNAIMRLIQDIETLKKRIGICETCGDVISQDCPRCKKAWES